MLTVDVISKDQISQHYDLILTSEGFKKLELERDQLQRISHRLAQSGFSADVRVALVMDQPSVELLPMVFIETADLVRYWNREQRQMVPVKSRY